MKVYNQAKDQVVIENVTDKGRMASFFSYGKMAIKVFTRASTPEDPTVFDVVEYDPQVLFASKTTAKHGKKFVGDKVARSDMWNLVKKHSQIRDLAGDLNTSTFSLLARDLSLMPL